MSQSSFVAGTTGQYLVVSGTLNDASGNPVPNEQVFAFFANSVEVFAGTGSVPVASANATTDSAGAFNNLVIPFTAPQNSTGSYSIELYSGIATTTPTAGNLLVTKSITVTPKPLNAMTGLTYGTETGSAAAGGSFAVATAATGTDTYGNAVPATGGVYSITNVTGSGNGISINSSTGAITITAGSTGAGTYTVTYTLSGVSTTPVTITVV